MRNRLIYAAVGVVGVLLIGLAIASATAWRASDVLRASAAANQAIVLTDPGVLAMGGDPVTVTATVPAGDHVTLAIGRDTDVAGWVGTGPDQRVTGLAGWHTLALASPTASPAPSGPVPASGTASAAQQAAGATPVPTDAGTPTPSVSGAAGAASAAGPTAAPSTVPDATSDMWVATAQGTGSATLTWQDQPGRWSLLVVGSTVDGIGVPPTVSMAWPRTVTTPYLVPGSVAGGLLVLLSLLLFWRDLRRRHGSAADWTPVLTDAIPVVTGAAPSALTRRQMREMHEMARTGQLPVVPAVSAAQEVHSPAAPATAPSTAPVAVVPQRVDDEPPAAREAVRPENDVSTHGGADESTTAAGADESAAAGGQGDTELAATGEESAVGSVATGAQGVAGRPADRRRPRWRSADVRAPQAAPEAAAQAAPEAAAQTAPGAAGPAAPGAAAQAAPDVVAHAAPDVVAQATDAATGATPHRRGAEHSPAAVPANEAAPTPERLVTAPAPGGRRARRQAATEAPVVEPVVGATPPRGPVPGQPSPAPGAAGAARPAAAARPTWMPPPSPDQPDTAAPSARPDVATSSAASDQASAVRDQAAAARDQAGPPRRVAPVPPTTERTPTAQPAWLRRAAARWDADDADDATPPAAVEPPDGSAPPSSADAPEPQPSRPAAEEVSRADAWRRAWGLPPLDTEKEER